MSGIFQALVDYLQFWADKITFEPALAALNFVIEFYKNFI